MKYFTSLLLALMFLNIQCTHGDKINDEDSTEERLTYASIEYVLRDTFPAEIKNFKFEDNNGLRFFISEGKQVRLEELIADYFQEIYGEDVIEHSLDIRDCYLETILLDGVSNISIYWVILKHISGHINSKILFHKVGGDFLNYVHDFNIHALYQHVDGSLQATSLKNKFLKNIPEIELINYDGNISQFRFTRLYHNGTANAIERTIIEVENEEVKVVDIDLEWIYSN